MRKTGLGLLPVFCLVALTGADARQRANRPNNYVLTVVATDAPNAERRSVQCLTSGDYFVDIVIPASAPVTRSGQPGKRLPLGAITAATKMVCRGDWTDGTRSVFRTRSVSLVGKVTRAELDRRFAAACARLKSPAPKPTPLLAPTERDVTAGFVVESATLERRDDLPVQTGTAYPAYVTEGVLHNISGATYERVEVQMSILDRDRKKIADQTAVGANIRTGDRWKFQGTPPVYLAYKNGHTVRVERVTGRVAR